MNLFLHLTSSNLTSFLIQPNLTYLTSPDHWIFYTKLITGSFLIHKLKIDQDLIIRLGQDRLVIKKTSKIIPAIAIETKVNKKIISNFIIGFKDCSIQKNTTKCYLKKLKKFKMNKSKICLYYQSDLMK